MVNLTMFVLCFMHLHTKYTGEKLVNFMVEPKKGVKWPKELPKFTSRPEAIAVCKELCGRQFMHRSEKVGKGELEVRYYMKKLMYPCCIFWTWNWGWGMGRKERDDGHHGSIF